MNPRALLGNSVWWLSCLPAWRKFRHVLTDPATTQANILRQLVQRAAETEFGREHQFSRIQHYSDFAAQVPIREYHEFSAWIDQIRAGRQNVLTPDRVIRLATTSGTASARKLIPYTAQLQQEFSRAVDPWIFDLFQTDPALLTGSAYWSVTPVIRDDRAEDSAVPIGFEQDTEYLGGFRSRLIDWVMAVPSNVQHAANLEEFRSRTLEHLKRRPDLRLISIWHPSFLRILLAELQDQSRDNWPGLRLISCWADAQAAGAVEELQKQFPGVQIQPKGLIATEAIVSIPFRGQFPLAVSSHFLEFLDDAGNSKLAHELTVGQQYEVIVTTGGGLWRYRLNDIVRVDGFIQNTPSIRFIGKAGCISDLFGEKLSEAFVSQVLNDLRSTKHLNGSFAMLAPHENFYVLYLQGEFAPALERKLDVLLRANPHYAYCRDLGQLSLPRIFKIAGDAHTTMLMRLNHQGQRLGDIKPAALSLLKDWNSHFQGEFIQTNPR